jgi:hypothetical protein
MPGGEAERLRLLAIEALATAMQMTDTACRSMMLDVAACYDRLADHAEQREVGPSLGEADNGLNH